MKYLTNRNKNGGKHLKIIIEALETLESVNGFEFKDEIKKIKEDVKKIERYIKGVGINNIDSGNILKQNIIENINKIINDSKYENVFKVGRTKTQLIKIKKDISNLSRYFH